MARTSSYNSDDIKPKLHYKQGPTGLGGWLSVMFAILISVSLFQIYMIIEYYPTFFAWLQITDAAPFKAGFMIRIIADFSLLLLAVVTIYFFINRSPRLPDLFNLWALTWVLTSATMDVCFMYDQIIIPHLNYPSFFTTQLSAIFAVLIIPYFISSVRVRNTFYGISKHTI